MAGFSREDGGRQGLACAFSVVLEIKFNFVLFVKHIGE